MRPENTHFAFEQTHKHTHIHTYRNVFWDSIVFSLISFFDGHCVFEYAFDVELKRKWLHLTQPFKCGWWWWLRCLRRKWKMESETSNNIVSKVECYLSDGNAEDVKISKINWIFVWRSTPWIKCSISTLFEKDVKFSNVRLLTTSQHA